MTYPVYENYRSSGAEWLGDVPEHWEDRRLKFNADLINNKIESQNIDLPFIGLEHIESWTGKRILDENSTSEGIASEFNPKDILFGKLRPYLAKVLLSDFNGTCSTEALILRTLKHVLPDFLKYYILSKDFINIVDSSTYGAKMPRASWEFIGNLISLIPPFNEQKAIANFLDGKTAKIDQLIEKKQALIEKLDEQRMALITNVVTGKVKVERTETPNGPTYRLIPNGYKTRPSGIDWLGDVPEHWDVKRLKFLTKKVQTGTTPPSNKPEYFENCSTTWFTPADFNSNNLYLKTSKRKINSLAIKDGIVKHVPEKSILVVGIGATLGKVGLTVGDSTCNQQINAIIPESIVSPEFIAYQLLVMKEIMKIISNATTLGIINQEKTKQIPMVVPGFNDQKMIESFIEYSEKKFINLVTKTQSAIEKLKEYRTSIITAAVTGKIKVL